MPRTPQTGGDFLSQGRFELYDHTADLGVRVTAPTRGELLRVATQSLYATIGELAPTGPAREMRLELEADDAAVLLRDYLARLLLMFETQGVMVVQAEAEEFSATRLVVRAQVRDVDRCASVFSREVKAVTYHELALRETPEGVQFNYIVDI